VVQHGRSCTVLAPSDRIIHILAEMYVMVDKNRVGITVNSREGARRRVVSGGRWFTTGVVRSRIFECQVKWRAIEEGRSESLWGLRNWGGGRIWAGGVNIIFMRSRGV